MAYIKNNYHTHTSLCKHAAKMPKDYIEKAISLGMKSIGISDHNHVPKYFYPKECQIYVPNYMTMDEFYNVYLKSINEAIDKYGDKIKIYKGLECEYVKEYEDFYKELRNNLDYLGLGLHTVIKDNLYLNTYFDFNYTNLHYYVDTAIEAIDSGLYKIFFHPDVFMVSYKNEYGEKKLTEADKLLCKKLIKHAVDKGIYLEVNANGIGNSKRDGYVEYTYPNKEFWKLVKEFPNAKIILGADAHSPDALYCDNITKAYEFVEELNLNIIEEVVF